MSWRVVSGMFTLRKRYMTQQTHIFTPRNVEEEGLKNFEILHRVWGRVV